jgi:hypothetical protein
MWKRWDALFMPKEVIWINFSLHSHQSVEVILEVLAAPKACLYEAGVLVLVHPQIKILVIHVRFPLMPQNIRTHVTVKAPDPVHMRLCILLLMACFSPCFFQPFCILCLLLFLQKCEEPECHVLVVLGFAVEFAEEDEDQPHDLYGNQTIV